MSIFNSILNLYPVNHKQLKGYMAFGYCCGHWGLEIKKAKNHWKQWHICKKKKNQFWWINFFLLIKNHQFWSPLFMTEEARHSFSLIDHGSVGPNINLCSVQRIKRQNIKRRMHFKCKRHSSTSGCVALRDALYKSGWAVWQLITGHI